VNWLTPLSGLILAAAVIPPLILLYFLKLRRKPQPIGSTLLWMKSIEDLRANAPFQRLRKSLLLLLQLLALVLLAISIMQPQIEAGQQTGGKTVMLIDTSASMTATDVEPDETRLEQAKRIARERIESRYAGGLFSKAPGETMIIAFSDPERAEVMTKFTASRQRLLDAIDRIRPSHGRTSLAQAFKLARAYSTNVDPEQAGRLVEDPAALELFSDGRVEDLAEQVLRQETLDYQPIGAPSGDNVAVTTISVERPYDRPSAVEVFAGLRNFNPTPVTVQVQLSVNEVALYVESISIEAATTTADGRLMPGGNNVVFTPFEQPRSAVIEVAILRADDLAADDVAHVVVPPPKRLDVALVSAGGQVSKIVLEGMALNDLRTMSPARYESLARTGGLEHFDVIVLDDYAPPSADLMPPGRYLCLGVTPPLEGFNDYGEGGRQVVLTSRDEHPALSYVNLENLYIARFRLVEPGNDLQVLAEGSSGPAIVAASRGPLQVIYVTFDPLDSNWPYQRSWVTFMFNAVDYLGHAGDALTSRIHAPGEAITTRIAPGATNVRMNTPDGQVLPVVVGEGGLVTWGPARLTGLHVLTWNEPDAPDPLVRSFAVNLLSETEGDIAAASVIQIGQDRIEGTPGGRDVYTPLWPWAIGTCLLVILFEWWVYHRMAYI
jgi:hypothetical protein